MRKKVTDRRSKDQRFREIEQALIEAGHLGLRVAGVAKKLGKSKSYAHKLLLEMVDYGLIERRVEYTDSDTFFVNYCYYQLPLFCEMDSGISHFENPPTDNQFLAWECEDCGTLSDGATCSICGGDNEYHG